MSPACRVCNCQHFLGISRVPKGDRVRLAGYCRYCGRQHVWWESREQEPPPEPRRIIVPIEKAKPNNPKGTSTRRRRIK
jgi:hypothetical protein